MKPNKNNSKSKLITFVIYFYRILGTTFGGVSMDANGNIIKSKFWYYYGWFGCGFYIIISLSILKMIILAIDKLLKESKLFMILGISGNVLISIAITAISIINQKYGFKIIKIGDDYSLTKFSKLKQVIIIWIIHLTICFSVYFVQKILYFNSTQIFAPICTYLILIPLLYSMSFISWLVSGIF